MTRALRFLHTADWHLGQPYRSLGPELAGRLRAERLAAVGRLLDRAGSLGVGLLLAAGDQFDGPNPDPELVRALLDRIAGHPDVEVHLIPGNHDPSEPGSIYRRAVFEPPPNLRVHLRAGPVPLPDREATLYPCPCDRRSGDDPMAWIPPRSPGDGLRIALAHGSLPECLDPGGRTYPIAADAPGRYDLDYVALGDWHAARPGPEQRPSDRMYYSGAPEVGGWDETGAGSALLVELEAAGAPSVRRIRTGAFSWTELAHAFYAARDVAELDGRLARLSGPNALVRVRASGSLTPEGLAALRHLFERRSADFAALILHADALADAAEVAGSEPEDPMLRESWVRLHRLRVEAPPGEAERPEVIDRAIELLRGLSPRADDSTGPESGTDPRASQPTGAPP